MTPTPTPVNAAPTGDDTGERVPPAYTAYACPMCRQQGKVRVSVSHDILIVCDACFGHVAVLTRLAYFSARLASLEAENATAKLAIALANDLLDLDDASDALGKSKEAGSPDEIATAMTRWDAVSRAEEASARAYRAALSAPRAGEAL